MKRLILPLMLLLITGCASIHIHKEVYNIEYLPQYDIPVFMTYGPNAIGYETIIEMILDDINIPIGAKIACNFVVPNDRQHFLLEGALQSKDPPVMNTPYGLISIEEDDVEFCLMSGLEIK